MSLKVIGSVLGVTGIVGGAVGATIGTTKVLSSSLAGGLSTKIWDCRTVEFDTEYASDVLKIKQEVYTKISCQDVKSVGGRVQDTNHWMGWFPKTLLVDNVVSSETILNFRLTTENEKISSQSNTQYKTTFKGERLVNSVVTGVWGDTKKNRYGQPETAITVSDGAVTQDKIHLLFPDGWSEQFWFLQ